MAMSASSLIDRWKAAFGVPDTPEGQAIQNDTFEKFAAAVIAEIQENAVVTVEANIAVSTTGTAAAQTGATTEPGTGTIA